MTSFEFLPKVSIKQPGPSQKKLILLFYLITCLLSLLNALVLIFEKVFIKQPVVLSFFQILEA